MLQKDKLNRCLDELNKMGLTQMLLSDPMAIYYLTNEMVHPGERFLGLYISQNHAPVLFINRLFSASKTCDIEVVKHDDTQDPIDFVAEVIDPTKKLGVDKTLAAKFLLPMMERSLATGFVNGSIAIDTTRSIKDEDEKEKMRKSSHINDLAMEQFVKLVHDGVTELEIANQMMDIYTSLGASGYSFDPIVSFGANAADPHHEPDNTVLKDGDCVLFDVGCVVDDYCSDMTRTFFYKYVSEEDARVYNLVKEANESAEAIIKPGVMLKDIDLTARKVISDEGLGEFFNHRLGHFIGLEDHEYGDVSFTNTNMTKEGNTFSIEPGIYLQDKVGVRIEDIILVTKDGVEVLNKFPKDLQIIK